ncbi:putative membrane WF-2 domain protein [Wolbachia endosymbiont of Trichogramma pretiosum]|nr:putative membrane WF-2 domain protein [Wolbachia endosymbiont of Trichogramma pretiosum]
MPKAYKKNEPDSHSGSGLRLKQVLSLVWKACKDKNKKILITV